MPNFFVDDVVCSKKKKQKIGTVVKTAWGSDDEDEDSSSDSEGPLKENCVKVFWNEIFCSNVQAHNLILLDRPLLHGDIVALASDPQGQTGTVVDVLLNIDIKMLNSTPKIINNVPSNLLSDIHPFMVGRYVVRKVSPKLVGVIDDVNYNLEVKFPDNSTGLIENVAPGTLRPESDSEDDLIVETFRTIHLRKFVLLLKFGQK